MVNSSTINMTTALAIATAEAAATISTVTAQPPIKEDHDDEAHPGPCDLKSLVSYKLEVAICDIKFEALWPAVVKQLFAPPARKRRAIGFHVGG